MKGRTSKRILSVLLSLVMLLSLLPVSAFATETETAATIAAWDFTAAPESLPANATTGSGSLSLSGAALTGYSTKSLASSPWDKGGYWQIDGLDTSNYTSLTFSAKMRSSKTGIRSAPVSGLLFSFVAWLIASSKK